jgi:tRNA(Arg) A34 adenosine deaminase TadA
MLRETTITVSYDEKDRLDEARREMFGTEEVPYGVVITRLAGKVLSSE